MLTFEQKLEIIESFSELTRKDVSLKRVNFHYEDSIHDKKNVVYHLHPNGNGYVYAELILGYPIDDKGFVNIRDFTADELRSVIEKSIWSLSGKPKTEPKTIAASAIAAGPITEIWTNEEGHTLLLKPREDLWYVYAGDVLDMAFETREEAEEYLTEEGFALQQQA
ncbi:hypothetical protein ACFOQM_14990 [Paenibacillus sp. GCM10012307]|uniref:Uncharacterized protein n=1 Tax=Paenibacillus roseus TaxID=2798579 RepID=A0A934J6L3_9BACL|nr:hypothetical protein [Paenibacillus roseus]MBJ6362568.1 hypothetical protein [Paenibacillus roseus]